MKRILIINSQNIYTAETSESVTIRSFLGKYLNNSALIQTGLFNIEQKGKVAEKVFCLSLSNKKLSSILINERRKSKNAFGTPVLSSSTNVSKNKVTLKSHLNYFLSGCCYYESYKIPKELDIFISDYKPDAIYACTTSMDATKLVLQIVKKHKLPFVFHIMDDWPNTLYNTSFTTKPLRYLSDRIVKKVIATASTVFCISQAMCDEYKKRYNADKFVSLMNCIADPLLAQKQIGIPHSFVYAGSLYLNRHEALIKICKVLADMDIPGLSFDIFASEAHWLTVKHFFEAFSFVHYKGFVSHDNLLQELNNRDVLVFVESSDPSLIPFTKLSLSTRVPEYLSFGKPILAIGPKGQASIDHLTNHEAAYVSSDTNVLKDNLKRLITDAEYNSVLSRNAYNLFKSEHEKQSQESKFANIIENTTLC